jgi:hypothetical protein
VTQDFTWSTLKGICSSHEAFKDASHWLTPLIKSSVDWPDVETLNRATRTLIADFPWEFTTQPKVPRRAKSRGMTSFTGYVELISSHGKIPVRENNAHDFLNCLSFLMFPKSKLALNARHKMESPEGLKPGQNRTRIQDLLTIFDEGGVVRLVTPSGRHKDFIFGHAVYEHILYGKSLRAARLDLPSVEFMSKSIPELTREADVSLAAWLSSGTNCRQSDEFSHLWITP